MCAHLMSALTSLLVRDGVVPVRQIEQALQRQVISGGDLETVLLEMDAVPENVLSGYRAAVFEVPAASREAVMNVEPELIALVPADVAIEQRIIPIELDGRRLHVAVHEPLEADELERLGFLLGYEIVCRVACEVRIAAGLAHHYDAELAPRMVRLVSKVHGRASGALPEVGPIAGRLGSHAADIPSKTGLEEPAQRPRYTRSGTMILEPAPPEEEEQVEDAVEPATSNRHTVPAPPLEEAVQPSRPSREPPDIAALKRHRGPITLAAGERMLRQSTDRDQILGVFFAFAQQFFDYTALFVVHEDSADGREAYGIGAPTAEVRALTIPLDKPGAFAEARRTRAPLVRRLDQTDTDRDVSLGLRRTDSPPAMIMPIAIRQRVVLILYGDRNGEDFDIGAAMELVRFGPRVVEAFEQLIIRKKRAGYRDGSDEEPERRTEEREALKTAAREAARRTSTLPGMDRRSWQPGRRKTTSPGFAPDTSGSTSSDSWSTVQSSPQLAQPIAELDSPSVAPVQREEAKEMEARDAAAELERAREAQTVPEGLRRRPRRPPSAILGIPRRAPPPPPSDGVEVGAPGLDDEEEMELLYETGDDAYEVELTVDEDDDGVEVVIDEAEEEPDEQDLIDTDPPPARASSRYSIKGAPVDVVRAARPPSESRRRPPSSEERRRRERKETPRERPPISTPPRRDSPPAGMDASTRSVIVDMGQQVHRQVEALLSAVTDEEQQQICDELIALGEAALPVLAQAFPGPLRWKREQRGRVPPAGQISPIMRALVAFGPRAGSYVAALLSSAHPDVRFYAAVVASEIVSPELMDAVAERIHDSDSGVRRVAVQLLPRFASFRGFAEIRTIVRRTARIRGKDLTRREHAIDAIAELRDVEMIPKLIELLREDDESLLDHVSSALVKITGADHGRSHRRWAGWWDKNRNRHRIEWLIDSLVSADEPVRRMAGEELKRITQEYYGYHAGSPKRDRELIAKKYRQWWDDEGQRRFA